MIQGEDVSDKILPDLLHWHPSKNRDEARFAITDLTFEKSSVAWAMINFSVVSHQGRLYITMLEAEVVSGKFLPVLEGWDTPKNRDEARFPAWHLTFEKSPLFWAAGIPGNPASGIMILPLQSLFDACHEIQRFQGIKMCSQFSSQVSAGLNGTRGPMCDFRISPLSKKAFAEIHQIHPCWTPYYIRGISSECTPLFQKCK